MQRRRFLACTATLAGSALVPDAGEARRLFPANTTDRYVAWQGDSEVGQQQFSFRRETGRFVVDVEMGMHFVSPHIGAVDYSHESREIWNTGWLHRLESKTRINASVQDVHAERRSGSLMVEGSDIRAYQVSTYVVPSNLWHRDSRLVDTFIDVENGDIHFVRPRYAGKDILHHDGVELEAHRYTFRGQLNREAWYDDDCVLVRWDLLLSDDDRISFRRDGPDA